MVAQPELALENPSPVPEQFRQRLVLHLQAINEWQTRKQLCASIGWSERQLRDVAESLGTDIVRGQAGFKLTSQITREDIGLALQAAEAFISQSRKNAAYGLGLKAKLHALIK